jgi:MFS family permease
MSDDGPRRSRAVFRRPDFRRYIISRFLWTLGQQVQIVAVGWVVYDITGDPLALGFIGLAGFIPAVPLSLLTGPVADRYDRRAVVAISCAVMALCAFGLCLTTLGRNVWPIYGLVILLGAARSFVSPAAQALMSTLVADEEFTSAVGWSNTFTQAATILGPSLGGLLFPFGALVPFIVACGVFVLAAILAAVLAGGPAKPTRERPNLAMLVAGYCFIWNQPVILGALTLDLVAVLLGGATALLPIYARDIFATGPLGLGILRSMPSIGAVISAFILAHRPVNTRVGRTMFACVVVYGLATIGFGLSTSMIVAIPCLIVVGGADIISVVIRQSLIQIATPNDMRGRVTAVHSIMAGTSNQLGEFESGGLAALVGTVPSVVIGGAGALLAAVIWMRLFPALRDRDGMTADRGET